MADTEETKEQEKQEDSKADKSGEKSSRGGFLQWIIIAVVVVLFAGAGFGLSRLLVGFGTTEAAGSYEQDQSAQVEDLTAADSETDSKKSCYYHLEPIVANLNVPDVTRYVRVSLTLEISSEISEKKCFAFIDERIPVLTSWLTVYLTSLSLEDIRGDRNLKRIQSQVLDAFNERLFPDSKPQIKQVLFKEFAVQ